MRSCKPPASRVAQGERRLEMLERVGVSVQRRGMLGGEAVAARPRPPDRRPGAGARRRGPRSPRPAAASTARPPRARGAGGAARGSSARRRARGASGARSRRRAPVPRPPARRPAPRAPRARPRSPRRCVRSPAARVSRSNDRPMAAAAPSTWRATSPSPPSRASSTLRTSVGSDSSAGSPPARRAARYSATNSGRPSLSTYTRRSRSGAASLGCAACTSVATSSSSSRAGLTIVALPSRARSTARRRSRCPGGTASLRQLITSSSARPLSLRPR